ncbi:DNA-damage-inducible protein F [compost metagenome]
MLPLVAVWSYLLDGLFIGATRAREMRNGMLLSVAIALPVAYAAKDLGNHGLWLGFLLFMALRAVTLGGIAWRLQRKDAWLGSSAR